jgi:hypothetical protein
MSEMHAETAGWIDNLRKRADSGERRMAGAPERKQESAVAHDRLRDLRLGLDEAERDHANRDSHRSGLEKMADEIDAAISRAIARM